MAQSANAQGQGEYVRSLDVLANCSPQVGGSYEVELTPAQTEQMGMAIQNARSGGNRPAEITRWIDGLQQAWGAEAGARAART